MTLSLILLHFTPVMQFQWEAPNIAVKRPVDQLWRLMAQKTCLRSRYVPTVKVTPIMPLKRNIGL